MDKIKQRKKQIFPRTIKKKIKTRIAKIKRLTKKIMPIIPTLTTKRFRSERQQACSQSLLEEPHRYKAGMGEQPG